MLFAIGVLIFSITNAQEKFAKVEGTVVDGQGEAQPYVIVILDDSLKAQTDFEGHYEFAKVRYGTYELTVKSQHFSPFSRQLLVNQSHVQFSPKIDQGTTLDTVVVHRSSGNDLGPHGKQELDDFTITEGKSEVITFDEEINTSTNNPREGYSHVPGANIWESDAYGIQLGIGVRGLSPNRSANFNVRQNGYDISADAIGYPESYYTPAFAALDRIEITRGSASLQFGPQFGGMMNFIMKRGDSTELYDVVYRQSVGSFGFLSSFVSLGGQEGKLNYYGYYNRKQADGWRPNSGFEHDNAFIGLEYQASKKLKVNLEYTWMNYLAHQAGGLTDAQFEDNPQQSNRERNWFKVNWNLLALNFEYKLTDRSSIDVRNFGLIASRDALGNLERINRPDDGGPRNLISDQYKNFGNETRFLTKYKLKNDSSVIDSSALIIGARFYKGHTKSRQGVGSSGSDADFKFYSDQNPDGSDYTFPNTNVALFVENLFKITDKWSIVPGVRYEWISTEADGYYNQVTRDFAGNIVSDTTIYENTSNVRDFLLFGIGSLYRVGYGLEVYGNVTQNYRPVTFSDIRINNPNKRVDENIKDENGYNAELGLRGEVSERIVYDVTGFYMNYNDRIGSIYEAEDQAPFRNMKVVRNLSDARIFGLELYAKTDLIRVLTRDTILETKTKLNWFVNTSFIKGEYINTEDPALKDRQVELIPQMTFKTGLSLKKGRFGASLLYSYVSKQYTDATNEEGPVPDAVIGVIPSYFVMDAGASFEIKSWLKLETGVNNLTNNYYFTRRADGYPGPGVIPSDARSFYATLQFNFKQSTFKSPQKKI
ncbi:TonB-dependent receptor [Cyclobacteriaceae bacterium]|nr:TonB-dependent receptor [Cyclobacteriaceae bacterium]